MDESRKGKDYHTIYQLIYEDPLISSPTHQVHSHPLLILLGGRSPSPIQVDISGRSPTMVQN